MKFPSQPAAGVGPFRDFDYSAGLSLRTAPAVSEGDRHSDPTYRRVCLCFERHIWQSLPLRS